MEDNGVMEPEVSPETERIALNIKPKAKRSPGQLEALKKAQAVRREKLQMRANKVDEPPAPPPSPAEVKPAKDYKAAYKAQKAELNVLRFEKALHDRLVLEAVNSAPPPTAAATEPAPAVSARRDLGPGWIIGAPVRKKNLQY